MPDPVARRIAQAARRLRRADQAAASASDGLDVLLRDAHAAGWSWVDLALAADLPNAENARARAARAAGPATGDVHPRAVTVAEAARLLGVTRRTVYARIERGDLATESGPGGRARVLLPRD